ncbi:MAG: TVP38/TMEM64 family protein, partial [Opitutales bacterium]
AFGLIWGFVLVSAGATLGAAAAFLIARHGARDWVAKRLAANAKAQEVDRAVSERGWKIVLLLRLSPVFPFNALNYILGLTGVRFWHYVLASWSGMLPGTLLYVYLGWAGRRGLEAAADEGETRTMEMVYMGLGLLATLAVTVYVTRVARRALQARTDEEALNE